MRVNEILNTALWKEKREWNKAFSDEIIDKHIKEKKLTIFSPSHNYSHPFDCKDYCL